MKKLFLCLLSFSLLVGCNNKKASEKTEGKTTEVKTDDSKPPEDNAGKDKETTATGWPEKDRNDFMTSCVNKALENINDSEKARKYCSCMLEKMEGEYPDVNKAAALTSSEIQAIMDKYRDGCNKD